MTVSFSAIGVRIVCPWWHCLICHYFSGRGKLVKKPEAGQFRYFVTMNLLQGCKRRSKRHIVIEAGEAFHGDVTNSLNSPSRPVGSVGPFIISGRWDRSLPQCPFNVRLTKCFAFRKQREILTSVFWIYGDSFGFGANPDEPQRCTCLNYRNTQSFESRKSTGYWPTALKMD